MYGVVLEGGGAKGAFHVGVLKALIENGYEIGGVTGTSIGAINGALIAQGDFDMALKLWQEISASKIMNIDDEKFTNIISKKIDMNLIKYTTKKIKGVISNKGIETDKIKEILNEYVNEDKLRRSKIDFGLVTFNVSDMKPMEVYKEDIPEGQLVSYIMASSNLPVFKSEPIEDKYFIDGGFYDNCPIDLLSKKGYKDIIVIRTFGIGRTRKINYKDLNIVTIEPSQDLGGILHFERNLIDRNIQVGYYDAIRKIKELNGYVYCISHEKDELFFESLYSINECNILEIRDILKLADEEPRKMLFEKIIPYVTKKLKASDILSYQQFLTLILEYVAEDFQINKYQIYKYDELLNIVQTKINKKAKIKSRTILKNNLNTVIYKIIESLDSNIFKG